MARRFPLPRLLASVLATAAVATTAHAAPPPGGLGVQFDLENGADGTLPRVTATAGRGPAQGAGIFADWYILSIDGGTTSGLSKDAIAEKLQGAPDTVVEVVVAPTRDGKFQHRARLKRERVDNLGNLERRPWRDRDGRGEPRTSRVAEFSGLTGKMVYAAFSFEGCEDSGERSWVMVGEPLEVLGEPKSARAFDGNESISAKIGGTECTVSLDKVLPTGLPFNPRSPGPARQFLAKLWEDTYRVSKQLVDLQAKAQFTPFTPHQWWVLEQRIGVQSDLLRDFLGGFSGGAPAALKSKRTKWVVDAPDKELFDWFCNGAKDKALRENLGRAKEALFSLARARVVGRDMAYANLAKLTKAWRSGVTDAPPDKLAMLDASESAALDAKLAKYQKELSAVLKSAADTAAKTKFK